MNCFEFKKHMDDLIDGKIDDSIRQDMEEHIGSCASCRHEYESTKFIIGSLRQDASCARLTDKQRKDIKEAILKSPVKKSGGYSAILKNMMYAAAIFMFVTAGVYFSGGVRINIGASEYISENNNLKAENEELRNENASLKMYVKDLESGKNKDWMMINPNIGEAIIEGKIVSIDSKSSTIRMDIYKDDNTPDIAPDIVIPDGVMISKVKGSMVENEYVPVSGSVKDLKVGDHITIHYIEKIKSARAVILYE